jgi:flagellar motor switch protein FliM
MNRDPSNNRDTINKEDNRSKLSSGDLVGVKAVLDKALQSYERLPMLEIVFEKFSQHLSNAFQHFTSEAVDVRISGFDSLRFGEYFKKLPSTIPIVVFKAIEWENLGVNIIRREFGIYLR